MHQMEFSWSDLVWVVHRSTQQAESREVCAGKELLSTLRMQSSSRDTCRTRIAYSGYCIEIIPTNS